MPAPRRWFLLAACLAAALALGEFALRARPVPEPVSARLLGAGIRTKEVGLRVN